jgi:four helix bundle protein
MIRESMVGSWVLVGLARRRGPRGRRATQFGMLGANSESMLLKKIEDFEVFKKANELWDAVNAILDRPALRNCGDLRDQLSDANDSILSNLDEGFEQPTDRAFAKYVYSSKASTAEVKRRLEIAHKKRVITANELQVRVELCDHVCRLATGLIAHLLRSNRKDRGVSRRRKTNKDTPTADQPPTDD